MKLFLLILLFNLNDTKIILDKSLLKKIIDSPKVKEYLPDKRKVNIRIYCVYKKLPRNIFSKKHISNILDKEEANSDFVIKNIVEDKYNENCIIINFVSSPGGGVTYSGSIKFDTSKEIIINASAS